MLPCEAATYTWYARHTAASWPRLPVRKSQDRVIWCATVYARTSATRVASGLASMPSSWMCRAAAGPSMLTASVMLTVDSGHTVVHRLSTKASTTTLPRNCRSATGVPD